MERKELDYFRALINKKKGELLTALGEIEGSSLNGTPHDQAGNSSAYPTHMADIADGSHQKEIAMTLASREGRYLHHLNEALARIKAGTYGKCRSCDGDIGRKRLEAVPHATQCIKCKNHEEKKQRGR